MITPDTFEELLEMNIIQLWKCFKMLMNEEDPNGKKFIHFYLDDFNKVQNGINLKVPIWYFTNKWYEVYPSNKCVKVMGYGKVQIKTFMEEKEGREDMMRMVIQEQMDDGSTSKPRTVGPEEEHGSS